MAKKKNEIEQVKPSFIQVLPEADYASDGAGAGLEEASAEDIKLPTLVVLSSSSQPVKKSSSLYNPDAEEGMFYLMPPASRPLAEEDKPDVFFQPIKLRKNYRETFAGKTGQGSLVEIHSYDQNIVKGLAKDGGKYLSSFDGAATVIEEIHSWLGFVMDPINETRDFCRLSFKGTSLNSSRNMTTLGLQSGKPLCANLMQLTPLAMSNAQGSWFVPDVKHFGYVPEAWYLEGKEKLDFIENSKEDITQQAEKAYMEAGDADGKAVKDAI